MEKQSLETIKKERKEIQEKINKELQKENPDTEKLTKLRLRSKELQQQINKGGANEPN